MPLTGPWSRGLHRLRLHGLLALGLREAALAVTGRRLACAPDDAHNLATRANLLAASGDLAAALSVQQGLVELEAFRPEAWFNLGFLLERMRKPAEAEPAFRRAIELAPELDRAWYGLGLCLIGQNRLAEAAPVLRRATELQPMSPFAWYQLARLHAECGDADQARHIIAHLRGFEPRVAEQLVRETGLAAGLS